MTYSTPPTFSAGAILTAAQLNTYLRDNFKALGDAWTSYTPTWVATTTNPTLGNGTLVGKYAQVGKLVHFRVELTIGSTTTVGVGTYAFALPVAPAASAKAALAAANVYDASADNHYGMTAYHSITFSGSAALSGDGIRWSATAPVVPDTGDVISISGSYEAA